MVLIDAHNLIGRSPGLSLSREVESREEILRRIATWASSTRQRVVAVFDGNRPCGAGDQRFGSVCVVFSPAGRSADDEILRRAMGGNPATVTVVTSDRRLADRARNLGCRAESCEFFLRRTRKPSRTAPEKPEPTQGDTEEWMNLFATRRRGA